ISAAIAAEHKLGSSADVIFTDVQNLAYVAEEKATLLADLLPPGVRSKVSFEYVPDSETLKMTVSPADADAVAKALAAIDEARLDAALAAFPGRTLFSINSYSPATVASFVGHRADLVELFAHEVPGPATIEHVNLTSVVRDPDETRDDYAARLATEFVSRTNDTAAGQRNTVTAIDVKSVNLPVGHVDAKTWEAAWKKAKELFAADGMDKVNIGRAHGFTTAMPLLTDAERADAKAKVVEAAKAARIKEKFDPSRDLGTQLQTQYATYTDAVHRETSDREQAVEQQTRMAEYQHLVGQYRAAIRGLDPSTLDTSDQAIFAAAEQTLQKFDADQSYLRQRQEFLAQFKAVTRDHIAFEQAAKAAGATKEALRDRYDILRSQRGDFDRQCRAGGKYGGQTLADDARDKLGDFETQVQVAYDHLPTQAEVACKAEADRAAADTFTKGQQADARTKIAASVSEFEAAQKRFVDGLAKATDEGEVAEQFRLLSRDHKRTDESAMAYAGFVWADVENARKKITSLFDQATAALQQWQVERRDAATARTTADAAVAHVEQLRVQATEALQACQDDLRSERFDDPDITKLGRTVERYSQAVDDLQAAAGVSPDAKGAAQQARTEFNRAYQAALAFHARRREFLVAWQTLSADHDTFTTGAPRATQPTLEADYKSLATRRQQLMTQCQLPGIYADQALAGAVVKDLEGKAAVVDSAYQTRRMALSSAPPVPPPVGPAGPRLGPPPPPAPKPATPDQAQFKLAESTGKRLKVDLEKVKTVLRDRGVDAAQKEFETQRAEFASYQTALEGLAPAQRNKLSRHAATVKAFDKLGTDIAQRAEELKALRARVDELKKHYADFATRANNGSGSRLDLLSRYRELRWGQRDLEVELGRRHREIPDMSQTLTALQQAPEGERAKTAYYAILLREPEQALPGDVVTNPRPLRVAGDVTVDFTLPDDVKLAFEKALPDMVSSIDYHLREDLIRKMREQGKKYELDDWYHYKWDDFGEGHTPTTLRDEYVDAFRDQFYQRVGTWMQKRTAPWRKGIERRQATSREYTALAEAFGAQRGECTEQTASVRALHEYLGSISTLHLKSGDVPVPPEIKVATGGVTSQFLQVHDYDVAHVANVSQYPGGKRQQWDIASPPTVNRQLKIDSIRANYQHARPESDASFVGFMLSNRAADFATDHSPETQLRALELYRDAVAYAPQNALVRSEAARFFTEYGEKMYEQAKQMYTGSSASDREALGATAQQVQALYQAAEVWLKDINLAEGYTNYRTRIASIRGLLERNIKVAKA
ncbi:MAG: hypothetical protein HY465_06090, partial [Deltaproteobacteria bacterium]|nr:hypothetical protein [Deltaproteobacteria bacterium]